MTRKIDFAVAAAGKFLSNMIVDGADRAMIASFGNTFRIDQDFTGDKSRLQATLEGVRRSVTNEATRLYDAIHDSVSAFWQAGRRDAGWGLIVVTDGKDVNSTRYPSNNPRSPALVGNYVAQRFNHEPTNFPVLVGVGRDDQIDAKALATIGRHGGFPAVALDSFEMLELLFLQIGLHMTTEIQGHTYRLGNISWHEISDVQNRLVHRPMDYLICLDRSGSMRESESKPATTRAAEPARRSGFANLFSRN